MHNSVPRTIDSQDSTTAMNWEPSNSTSGCQPSSKAIADQALTSTTRNQALTSSVMNQSFTQALSSQASTSLLGNQASTNTRAGQAPNSNPGNQASVSCLGNLSNQACSSTLSDQASISNLNNQTSSSSLTNQVFIGSLSNESFISTLSFQAPTLGNQASYITPPNQSSTSTLSSQPSTITISNQSSASSMGNQNLIAYVHNVTSVLSSTSTGAKTATSKYFEMQLQTKDDVRRGVCFSPAKLSEFQSVESKTSPVKLINYDIDKVDNKSVLMGARVKLFEMPVSFPKATLKSNVTLGSLSAVADNQLISLDAKVVKLQGRKKVNTRYGLKEKISGFIVDPHGAITIELWEDFIPQVEEGGTYTFKNLRVLKNQYNGSLFVGTPAGCNCTITPREDFSQPLATPTDLPDTFLTKTTQAEFIGIKTFAFYYTCFKCKGKITDSMQVITKCTKCGLTQKVEKCKKTCYI